MQITSNCSAVVVSSIDNGLICGKVVEIGDAMLLLV